MKPAFRVGIGRIKIEGFQDFTGMSQDHPANRNEIRVEINRTSQCFVGIGERGSPVAAPATLLAFTQHEVFTKVQLAS